MGGTWLLNRLARWLRFGEGASIGVAIPVIKLRRTGNVQILTYHRVNDEHDPFCPGVPIQIFAEEMEYVVNNFHVCSLDEAVEGIRKRDLAENTVVVTFDDGYKDNYLNAYPILRVLSMPATVFLATDAIGTGKVLWHDQVFSAFRQTKKPFLEWINGGSNVLPLGSIQDRLAAQVHVLQCLRRCSPNQRSKSIDCLIRQLEVSHTTHDPSLMLDWNEVEEMRRHDISIGAHTATHPILSTLSEEEMKIEIRCSTDALIKNLGAPPLSFAYPNGRNEDFTDKAKEYLEEAGYACAVSTVFGFNEYGQDLYALKRGGPWEEFLPMYALKLNWYRLMS